MRMMGADADKAPDHTPQESSDDFGHLGQYFRTAKPASPITVRPTLWNAAVTPATYAGDGEKYQGAVLEQYKICVEMADRISARRALANSERGITGRWSIWRRPQTTKAG